MKSIKNFLSSRHFPSPFVVFIVIMLTMIIPLCFEGIANKDAHRSFLIAVVAVAIVCDVMGVANLILRRSEIKSQLY